MIVICVKCAFNKCSAVYKTENWIVKPVNVVRNAYFITLPFFKNGFPDGF